MRCSLATFVTLSLAVASLEEPTLSSPNVHEKRSVIPVGWSHTRKHESAATVPLRIALKQSNIESIDEHLYDASHPASANYGKHRGDFPKLFTLKFPPSDTGLLRMG